MCQAKSLGGKRCLAHSAASRAFVRLVTRKTGANADMVQDTLKELNKEGRNLSAPTATEVKELFDRNRFVAEHDPDLDPKDSKLIVKNLIEAENEAKKQGVTAGAFHAWKNLMRRVTEKMKRGFKVAAVFGVAGLALAGCANGDGQTGQTPAPTDPTSSSQPADPSAEPTTPAADLVDEDTTDDWVPLAEVTDEYGTYTRLTVDPNSELLQLNPETVNQEMLDQYGFTTDQASEAQQAVVTYMMEGFLDGERLDNYSMSYEEWAQSDAAQAWSQSALDESLGGDMTPVTAGLIVSDYLPQPLNRGGGQRGTHQASVIGIEAYTGESTGVDLINVGVAFDSYYLTSEDAAQAALAQNTGQPAETFRDSMPALFDGDGEAQVTVSGQMWFGYNPEDGKLYGAAGTWTPTDGPSGASYYTGQVAQ